ncbi:MAG: coproporphyrinogen oxidase [Gammaproteobacteria bacterium]|jgi:oxygen-independent coproporphyrinogen-3 oxidase|nr:coproporphyrinogen oxidase [Gammaproteobacteria bacterium]
MLSAVPLSLYIHFPWCVKKCPYCDFNSHQKPNELPEEAYIKALLQDLKQDADFAQGRPIQSIFLGGGTPSLFSAKALADLFAEIQNQISLASDCEITLEANPGTIERGQFSEYRSIGINRISLGVQSFQTEQLKKLGRIHSGDEAARAVEEIHRAGFDNFNIDLMHGLPGQTLETGLSDIKKALELAPSHLSWYQLTIEPNTLFYAKPPQLPEDEILASIEIEGEALLAQAGFMHYETSAFAKPGRQCRHNINYWQFGDYLGIGAGAHAKITDPSQQKIFRSYKHKHPKAYLNPEQNFIAEMKTIDEAELPMEFMLNCLRLKRGFSVEQFESRTGLKLESIEKPLSIAYQKGLLEREANIIRPTALGAKFLNEILTLF